MRVSKKKGKKSSGGKGEIAKAVKRLDYWFSWFIRIRGANGAGLMGRCFTCGKTDELLKLQCGHYVSRRHYSLRWSEKNCEIQCVGCNVFNQGNGPAFAQGLIRKHGVGIIPLLEIGKNNKFKLEPFILKILTDEYRRKVECSPQWKVLVENGYKCTA